MQILNDLTQAFGTTRLLAERLGVHHTRIYAWKRDRQIPAERMRDVVEAAREKGLKFLPEDLLPDAVQELVQTGSRKTERSTPG